MIERIQEQKNKNALRTLILFAGMLVLMVALGYVWMGWQGLVWAGILGGISLYATYQIPTAMIMRLYRAQPLSIRQAPHLFNVVQQLSHQAGLSRIPRLYYVHSGAINAFATGRKDDPAIAVTYGLLNSLNMKEVTGVLAHEISHIVHNDMRLQGMANLVSRITRFFSFMGQLLLIINFPLLLIGDYSIPWAAILLLIIAPALTTLLLTAISRTRELDADLEAARITGDPNSLADALEKINRMTRRRVFQPFQRNIPNWLSTHPQIEERVKRLRELAPRYRTRISWPEIEWFLRNGFILR